MILGLFLLYEPWPPPPPWCKAQPAAGGVPAPGSRPTAVLALPLGAARPGLPAGLASSPVGGRRRPRRLGSLVRPVLGGHRQGPPPLVLPALLPSWLNPARGLPRLPLPYAIDLRGTYKGVQKAAFNVINTLQQHSWLQYSQRRTPYSLSSRRSLTILFSRRCRR